MKYIKIGEGFEKFKLNWLFENRIKELKAENKEFELWQPVMNQYGDIEMAKAKTLEELKIEVKEARKRLK